VTRVELTGSSPALSQEAACIQRTAEEMLARAADIEVVAIGPVDPENGVRVLSMRNTVTGNTADCFYNEIDGQVTRVELTGDSPALSPEDACIQRTAEEMVVRTADIMIVATGPVDPENGVRVLSMRNTVTGNTADCFYNEVDQQVTRVELTGASTR
jgi:molybdenum cofactor biosynthesis enzyme MoaA